MMGMKYFWILLSLPSNLSLFLSVDDCPINNFHADVTLLRSNDDALVPEGTMNGRGGVLSAS